MYNEENVTWVYYVRATLLHQHERVIYALAQERETENLHATIIIITVAVHRFNDFYVYVYVRSRENALFADYETDRFQCG